MRSEEWLCIRAGALFRDGPPPTDPRMLGRSPTSTTRPSLRYHSLTPSTLLFIFNPMIYMADSTADTSVHSRVRSIKVNLFIVFSFFSLHHGRQSLFLSFPLRQIRSTHASSWPLSFFIQIMNISYDQCTQLDLLQQGFSFVGFVLEHLVSDCPSGQSFFLHLLNQYCLLSVTFSHIGYYRVSNQIKNFISVDFCSKKQEWSNKLQLNILELNSTQTLLHFNIDFTL